MKLAEESKGSSAYIICMLVESSDCVSNRINTVVTSGLKTEAAGSRTRWYPSPRCHDPDRQPVLNFTFLNKIDNP